MGNSLVVLWLGFWAFTAEIQSLVRELRSHELSCVAKRKRKKERECQSLGEGNQDGRKGED